MELEKILESPLDCKEIQPVNPKGNQFLIFIGRTDAEAETPILWPPNAKNLLIGKTLMLGKIEGGRRGQLRLRWVDGITDSMDMSLSKLLSWWWTGKTGMLQSIGLQRVKHELNWTEPNWIREFSSIVWYKINIQKSFLFLYTNNKKSETEIKESIPFTTATKRIKYLGIDVPKEMK